MRLLELTPKWYTLAGDGPRVGISFECPHCRATRLAIVFHHKGKEAIEDAVIHAESPSTDHIWTIEGNDFDDITFSPSIDASASGHWHGFIRNGVVA
jgi:Family of unknown function (DUF6527)